MVRPPKVAVLLVSVHPLPDQRQLHLHAAHLTDLLFTYSPQAPADDCSYQEGSEGRALCRFPW